MAEMIKHRLIEPLVTTLRGPQGETTEQIVELTITPLQKAKQLRALDRAEGEVGKGIALIAECCGIPVAQAEELSIADFTALMEIVGDFLPDGLRTGATP